MDYDGLRFSSVMTRAAGRDVLLAELTVANTAHNARFGLIFFLKLLSGLRQPAGIPAEGGV